MLNIVRHTFCKLDFMARYRLNRIELLLILSLLFIFVLLAIPALNKAKAKSQRISCVCNLKNIGLGYRIFATDHSDQFPWETNVGRIASLAPADEILQHFLVISNELSTPKILACKSDTRKPAPNWATLTRANISYFLNINSAETFPQSFLAGDRNLTTNGVKLGPGRVKITQDSTLSWDPFTMHKSQGSMTMGDGSVQQFSNTRAREQWKNTGQTDDVTFLFP